QRQPVATRADRPVVFRWLLRQSPETGVVCPWAAALSMTEGSMSRSNVAGLALSVLAVLPLQATAATPSATCRTTDRPETGYSGETTAAERDAGLPAQGFKCNTDLVGQYQGEGASWQLTAWKNCAYFDQRHPAAANPNGSTETHPGVVVVDVSDPTHP